MSIGKRAELWKSAFPLILKSCCHIYPRGVYLLRPTDGCCFCLRTLLRKPQQTDGGYGDLLKTDTLTFKAVSLSVERNESYTTSCQPHIITASTTLLQKQHAVSRAEMWASKGIETWKRRESLQFFFCLFIESKVNEHGVTFTFPANPITLYVSYLIHDLLQPLYPPHDNNILLIVVSTLMYVIFPLVDYQCTAGCGGVSKMKVKNIFEVFEVKK